MKYEYCQSEFSCSLIPTVFPLQNRIVDVMRVRCAIFNAYHHFNDVKLYLVEKVFIFFHFNLTRLFIGSCKNSQET